MVPFSASFLLLGIAALIVMCCVTVTLLIGACCSSRRRDTVAESSDARWLPGVGIIDYVPPSNRSSVRVSLLVEDEDNWNEDPSSKENFSLQVSSISGQMCSASYPFRSIKPNREENEAIS